MRASLTAVAIGGTLEPVDGAPARRPPAFHLAQVGARGAAQELLLCRDGEGDCDG